MKHLLILFITVFYAFIAQTASSLEETTETIQKLRQRHAMNSPKYPYGEGNIANTLNKSVNDTYDILEGRRSIIVDKPADETERVKVLSALFQAQIVQTHLGQKLHEVEIDLTSPHKSHLIALWIMTQGVRAYIDSPNLGPAHQDILNHLKSISLVPKEVKDFLTLQVIEILFPKGFFETIITYAYRYKDYKNQEKLKFIMSQLEIKISTATGFNVTPLKPTRTIKPRTIGDDTFLLETFDSGDFVKPSYTNRETKLREETQKLREENTSYLRQTNNLTAQLKEVTEQHARIINNLKEQIRSVQQASTERQHADKVVYDKHLAQEEQGWLEKIQALTAEKEKIIEELKQRENTLKNQQTALNQELSNLKEGKETLKRTLETLQTHQQGFAQQTSQQLQELTEKVEKYKEKIKGLKNALVQAKEVKGATDKHLALSQRDKQEADQRLIALETEKQKAQQDISTLTTQNQEIQQQLITLTAEKQTLQHQYDDLTKVKDTLNQTIEKLRETMTKLQGEINSLRSANSTLAQEKSDLEEKNKTLAEEKPTQEVLSLKTLTPMGEEKPETYALQTRKPEFFSLYALLKWLPWWKSNLTPR